MSALSRHGVRIEMGWLRRYTQLLWYTTAPGRAGGSRPDGRRGVVEKREEKELETYRQRTEAEKIKSRARMPRPGRVAAGDGEGWDAGLPLALQTAGAKTGNRRSGGDYGGNKGVGLGQSAMARRLSK